MMIVVNSGIDKVSSKNLKLIYNKLKMEITAKSSTRVLAPEGVHMARCIKVIDLGTVKSEYDGKEIKNKKIQFAFELVDTEFQFDEESDPRPFVVYKDYTQSISAKSILAKDLASWTGKKIDPKQTFKPETMLNKECQIQVQHVTSKSGSEYVKIVGVMQVPNDKKTGKPIKVTKAANPTLYLSLDPDEFDQATFDELPEFLQENIKDTPEYKALGLSAPPKKGKKKAEHKPAAKGKGGKKVPF